MRDHPKPEVLELFVIDGLDDAEAAAVAAHVRGCQACAAALAREARLEASLYEVAKHSKPDSNVKVAPIPTLKNRDSVEMAARRARLAAARRVRRATSFAAAAAAAVAIWIAARRPPVAVAAAPPVLVTCLEATDPSACAASARSAGLVVQFPAGAARFDALEDSAGPMDANQGE